jgi:DnaJ-class molecular chaperone
MPNRIMRRAANQGGLKRVRVNAMTQKIKEHACAACNGTGFPVVKQPVLATRKIYPAKCEACDGKGRITDAD